MQGRRMIGALNQIIGFREMCEEVKKGLRDSILGNVLKTGCKFYIGNCR